MFGLRGYPVFDVMAIFHLREYAVLIAAGIFCATPVFSVLRGKVIKRFGAERLIGALEGVIQMVLFMVGVSALVMNAHNPFIYFNF